MPIDANTYFQGMGLMLSGLSIIALVMLFLRCREDYRKDRKPPPPMERKDLLKRIEATKSAVPDMPRPTRPPTSHNEALSGIVGPCARCKREKPLIFHTMGGDICEDCVFDVLNWKLPAEGKFKGPRVKMEAEDDALLRLRTHYRYDEEGQDTLDAVRRDIRNPSVDDCTEHLGRPVNRKESNHG